MKTQDKLLITLGTAAVLAVSGFVGFSLFATPDSQASTPSSSQVAFSNQTTSAPTTSSTNNTSSSTTGTSTRSSYKDGTYTATSSYMVPHGAQNSITSTIVVSSGKITSVTTSNNYSDHESANYIDWFNQEISSAVAGQGLGDISVSRVGGASLTTSAFNDTLDTIRTQATV